MVFTTEKMTTLGEVNERVNELSLNCWDDFIQVGDISFQDIETINIAGEPHPLRSVAQRSISARLGIPFLYLQKCPSYIAAVNLNYWISKYRNQEFFVRFKGDAVRGIFSKRYKVCDNREVIDRLFSMGYDQDTPVQSHSDEDFMLLNIPDTEKEFSVNGGDKMQMGCSISNSEVGLASLTISQLVMRLVCKNGLISRTRQVAASYRHISGDLLDKLSETLKGISEGAIQHKNKLQLSLNSRVENPLDKLKSYNAQFQLNQAEVSAVDWAWQFESGLNTFAIIQTYTRAAGFSGISAVSAYRLQRIGGDLLAQII